MSQWPNQQWHHLPICHAEHSSSLPAATAKGKEERGSNNMASGTACTPIHGARVSSQSPREQEAGKESWAARTISSSSQSSTYSSYTPVILKQAPSAGKADAKGSSIWIRMWLSLNCSPTYKRQQHTERVQPSWSLGKRPAGRWSSGRITVKGQCTLPICSPKL